MAKKIVTTIEEYDDDGHVIKKTVREETDDGTDVTPLYYPYPWSVPYEQNKKDWWRNPYYDV